MPQLASKTTTKQNINIDNNQIICGDIISILKNLPLSYQYDVIIIDPPYNIGKNFGNNNDNMKLDEYIEWCNEWLKLCFAHLKNDGLIYVYGFTEILSRLAVHYDIDKQRFLIWHYTNKTIPFSYFWQRSHESILCLWKYNKPRLQVNQIREPYTDSFLKCVGKERQSTKGRFTNGNKKTFYKAHGSGALPRDVIKIPSLAGGLGSIERWFLCRDCDNKFFHPKDKKKHLNHNILQHPTQKPFKLTKKLIQSKIKGNNGKLLIPFVGSGSECVVAKSLGIEFLGIEINNEYVDFANKWLEAVGENYVSIDK